MVGVTNAPVGWATPFTPQPKTSTLKTPGRPARQHSPCAGSPPASPTTRNTHHHLPGGLCRTLLPVHVPHSALSYASFCPHSKFFRSRDPTCLLVSINVPTVPARSSPKPCRRRFHPAGCRGWWSNTARGRLAAQKTAARLQKGH